MYPVELYDSLTGGMYKSYKDANAFKIGLGEILQSDKLKRIVSSLLAQS